MNLPANTQKEMVKQLIKSLDFIGLETAQSFEQRLKIQVLIGKALGFNYNTVRTEDYDKAISDFLNGAA